MAAKKKKAPAKPNSILLAAQALAAGHSEKAVNSADSIALWAMANGLPPAKPGAAAPTPPAAQAPAVQATPAANKPVNPYLTPEQQMAADDQLFQIDDGVYNFNKAYGDLEANTKYETAGVNKREQENNAAAVENMIARGLFRSSIKDAELADVAASAQARRDYLTTGLETARIDRDVRVKRLGDRKLELFGTDGTAALGTGGSWDQIGVQNAQAVEPVPTPTTPGVDTGPLNTGTKPDPGQKTVAVKTPKAQQQAASAFATRTAQEQAKAAKAESQSASKKRKVAKPKKRP